MSYFDFSDYIRNLELRGWKIQDKKEVLNNSQKIYTGLFHKINDEDVDYLNVTVCTEMNYKTLSESLVGFLLCYDNDAHKENIYFNTFDSNELKNLKRIKRTKNTFSFLLNVCTPMEKFPLVLETTAYLSSKFVEFDDAVCYMNIIL